MHNLFNTVLPWFRKLKQPQRVFYEKAVLKNFAIFTGN